ncbi:uncharacterized protein [Euphorbia lathyris]|uniref:uncharacterized protein n=1 Tax=Euphorbia lathyris TaxID=212925 RepID=UPI0033140F24
MEGVGARLGRSSTRYGPATVFSGPVRKWKKRWVHVSPSSNSAANLSHHHHQNHHHHHHIHSNNNSINAATSNGNNGSHLLLYKWTPLTQSNKENGENKLSSLKDDDPPPLLPEEEEPPRRKFKYLPVYLLEKQKYEAGEETKLSDDEPTPVEQNPKYDDFDEKPDINDTPMEEIQDDNQVVRQDLNESTLDLSLGLNSHDDDSDVKPDQSGDGQLERLNSSSVGT